MIDKPVRMTKDQTIVDRNNRVVCLLCWKNDVDHVRKQERIGSYLVGLINTSYDDAPSTYDRSAALVQPAKKKK